MAVETLRQENQKLKASMDHPQTLTENTREEAPPEWTPHTAISTTKDENILKARQRKCHGSAAECKTCSSCGHCYFMPTKNVRQKGSLQSRLEGSKARPPLHVPCIGFFLFLFKDTNFPVGTERKEPGTKYWLWPGRTLSQALPPKTDHAEGPW
jgi:hypothetical protein